MRKTKKARRRIAILSYPGETRLLRGRKSKQDVKSSRRRKKERVLIYEQPQGRRVDESQEKGGAPQRVNKGDVQYYAIEAGPLEQTGGAGIAEGTSEGHVRSVCRQRRERS